MGKSTISMAIFNSYVKLPEGNFTRPHWCSEPSGQVWASHGYQRQLGVKDSTTFGLEIHWAFFKHGEVMVTHDIVIINQVNGNHY